MTIISGMKLQLDEMRDLDAKFGHPSKAFLVVHVAGTNGKGSVTTKIATSLTLKNQKVGLYTSPHISTFRERIRINGEMIPDDVAENYWETFRREGVTATFFECMTLMAFLYFAEQKVDVAVVEVGLGGRLDATNIVESTLSIITSISFDHTNHLGKTLEEIGQEKAGIIKPKKPVLVGPTASCLPLFEQKARALQSPFFAVTDVFENYEQENREIASKALDLLPFASDKKGLSSLPPCRFERFEREIPIVLDVAHNPAGFEALFSRLKHQKIHLLMGLGEDKEIDAILESVCQRAEFVHLTKAQNPRALDPAVVEKKFLDKGYAHTTATPNVRLAFRKARKMAFEKGALLCVCGTFYIMSEIRSELGIVEACDPILMSPY